MDTSARRNAAPGALVAQFTEPDSPQPAQRPVLKHVATRRIPRLRPFREEIVFDPSPPPLPDRFPHRHGAAVVIRTHDRKEFRSTCRSPRGSGPRGIEWSDVEDEYRALAPLAGLAPRQAKFPAERTACRRCGLLAPY